MGVGFDDISVDRAVDWAHETIQGGGKSYVVTPNPEIVWLCRRNKILLNAIAGAGLVLPDGIGIVYGAKILGTPLSCGRVPGIDFVGVLLAKMAQSGMSVFLLGAKPGVAETAGEKLLQMYPGLLIAGTADGYFSDDQAMVKKINSAHPDLLLVCLGAPKQELWITSQLNSLNVPLCAGLGGVLDVFAGNVKRAPMFFQRFGLEWLYRIAKEPRRLKRSLRLPLFLLAVIRKRL